MSAGKAQLRPLIQPLTAPKVQTSDKENDASGDRAVSEKAASKGAGAASEYSLELSAQDRWARHCHSTLGAVAAAPILKASNSC